MAQSKSKGAFIPLILLGVGVGALFLFQGSAVAQPSNGARAIIGDAIVHRPE
ncbi:hypothetical protein [Orenia marismortui]|uniref:Uncharacterized protein n=1 Tax=Orenia marismortui TaxID=46469 RepID=A0A4R8GV64_9FIRM|nr:hypothetical protein [Orenia marismortui]TDX48835.1 hypothetical protein C7959_12514 [Orenia marismortui]